MPSRPARSLRPVSAVLAALCLLGGAAGCADRPARIELSADDTIKAGQRALTDQCLARRGLTPPGSGSGPRGEAEQRRVSQALFGTGPAELSLSLPTAYRGVDLASVRRTHRTELADWRRMRSRALERARALLNRAPDQRAARTPRG
ncbi:hypothetical protein AB0F36_29385 [Streptomyces sp. NPDC029080]|uniref:hypothetical protein n=1 Tax=Streptomyces sp. NPDC029080 TaxID=3155017 RepID=UPI0033DDADEC